MRDPAQDVADLTASFRAMAMPQDDAGVAATLAAGMDMSRRRYDAGEFLSLPPAEFVARAYAALFRRPPDAAAFGAARDRLLSGQITRAGLLKAFQTASGADVHISGLARARRNQTLRRSLPVQAALAAMRLARNIRRLPRNIRRSIAQKDTSAAALPQRPAAPIAGRPRVAVVASTSTETGGAERFYLGLCEALQSAGMAVELVLRESREGSFSDIQQSYCRFHDLNLSAFDGVISTKAPSYAVRHRNHVCYLVHTMRAYYDMFAASHPYAAAGTQDWRSRIQALDTAALQTPRRLFAIGEEVTVRLRRFNGLNAQTLHFPISLAGLRGGGQRYLFLPGRLHPWKRVDLAIRAMRFVKAPVRLVIAGAGQEDLPLRALAGHDPRIEFTGRVSDEALAALYADALAVLFLPLQEDLGLITLEAFAAGKPVITCRDSGEPARLVRDGQSGFVCPPDARAIAEKIEKLAGDPGRAAAMGRAGQASVASISWEQVAQTLTAALGLTA